MSFFNGKHAVGVGFRLCVLLSWPICYLAEVHMGFLLWMLAAMQHLCCTEAEDRLSVITCPVVMWWWQGTAFLNQLLLFFNWPNFYKYKDKTDIFTAHTDINNYVEGRDLGPRMEENTIAFVARSLEKLGYFINKGKVFWYSMKVVILPFTSSERMRFDFPNFSLSIWEIAWNN